MLRKRTQKFDVTQIIECVTLTLGVEADGALLRTPSLELLFV